MNDIMRLERAYEIAKSILSKSNNEENAKEQFEKQNDKYRKHLSIMQIKSDIKFVLDNLKEQQRS